MRWVHVCDNVDGSSKAALLSVQNFINCDAAAVVDCMANIDRWLGPVVLAQRVDNVGAVQVRLVML